MSKKGLGILAADFSPGGSGGSGTKAVGSGTKYVADMSVHGVLSRAAEACEAALELVKHIPTVAGDAPSMLAFLQRLVPTIEALPVGEVLLVPCLWSSPQGEADDAVLHHTRTRALPSPRTRAHPFPGRAPSAYGRCCTCCTAARRTRTPSQW